ncbi:hypothetical protein JHK87_033566 [Glycine soja]|nr:hypothetical protein JHK87_033566 [Glycine soja]
MVPGHIITFSLWIALRQIEGIDTHNGLMFIMASLDGQASLLETSYAERMDKPAYMMCEQGFKLMTYLSLDELRQMYEEQPEFLEETFWYKAAGKDLNHGLKQLFDDIGALEMVDIARCEGHGTEGNGGNDENVEENIPDANVGSTTGSSGATKDADVTITLNDSEEETNEREGFVGK